MNQLPLEAVAKQYCQQSGHSFVSGVGRGAFKETFEVRNQTGDAVALKIYRPGFSVQRTEREISAMRKCAHPSIAQLFSVAPFELNGASYLVTLEEFLPGGTLTQRLVSGPMAADDVFDLGARLIDAVSHIASHDLVHRDLKPDNILFRADRTTPVVVDFGLVRDLGAESLTHTWLLQGPGTPLFAPPEQLRNEKNLIDWRSDQFSLAVLLSVSAFACHPYAVTVGDPPVVIIERVANRGAVPNRFLESAQQAGLSSLCRMVSQWPVARYRTPGALIAAWQAQRGTT